MTEYLAIVIVGPGGSTFARGKGTPQELAKRCAKLARSDWSGLFKIPEDHEWKINLYDMTGIDGAYWDDSGVYEKGTDKIIPRHSIVKVIA